MLGAMASGFVNLDAALGNPVTTSKDSPVLCKDTPGETQPILLMSHGAVDTLCGSQF